jgi:hypothetical protein
MSSLTIKRSLASAAVIAGLLGIAGSANAQGGGADFTRLTGGAALVSHCGATSPGFSAPVGSSISDLLGATGPKACISDGTSNTVLFALRG